MRKFILASALAATLVPAGAFAQSYGQVRQDNRDVRHDRRDARHDRVEDRADRREDWREYRRAHPDVYRGTAYVGPSAGWRYRPVNTGYRFQPAYYGQRYWIDPARYRLPPAAAWQRWVRYGNDVVLVNVRNGVVATVYPGFFY